MTAGGERGRSADLGPGKGQGFHSERRSWEGALLRVDGAPVPTGRTVRGEPGGDSGAGQADTGVHYLLIPGNVEPYIEKLVSHELAANGCAYSGIRSVWHKLQSYCISG